MDKLLSRLLVLLLLCGQLVAMEYLPEGNEATDEPDREALLEDEIIYLNIGGLKIDITRSTIEIAGGDFLNALLSGKFVAAKDTKGRIFIDLDQEEGKLIAYFIRNQQLPEKFDRQVATSAAEYFGIEAMGILVEERKSHLEELKIWKDSSSYWTYCAECTNNLGSSNLYTAVKHLLDVHQAEIVCSDHQCSGYGGKWSIMYRLPAKQS